MELADGPGGRVGMAEVAAALYATSRERVRGLLRRPLPATASTPPGSRSSRPPPIRRRSKAPLAALFAAPEPPTALLCQSDRIAMRALDWLSRTAALAVPGDVSVVGFDGVPEGAVTLSAAHHRRPADRVARPPFCRGHPRPRTWRSARRSSPSSSRCAKSPHPPNRLDGLGDPPCLMSPEEGRDVLEAAGPRQDQQDRHRPPASRARSQRPRRRAHRPQRGPPHPRMGRLPPPRRRPPLPDLRQRLHRRHHRHPPRYASRGARTIVPWRQVFSDGWLGRRSTTRCSPTPTPPPTSAAPSAGWPSSTPTSS